MLCILRLRYRIPNSHLFPNLS